MSKKFFFIGVAALLSVSLFMFGCSSDSDGGGGPTPAQQAVTLAGKLNGIATGTAVVNGATVTLSADVSLTETTTVVPAGVTLAVPSGKTLTVPVTKTLTVAGTLSVGGSVVLGAAADATVVLQAGAELSVAATGGLFSGNNGNDQTKVKITVAASGAVTAAKVTGDGGDYWLVPTPGDNGASNVNFVLGKLTLVIGTGDVECAASSPAAAGRLKAGDGAVITFGGST
jgi:hypothetical protein